MQGFFARDAIERLHERTTGSPPSVADLDGRSDEHLRWGCVTAFLGGTGLSGYTVIDFETTGLFPQKHDRVVEIGVVYVNDEGEVQGEWSSLVNPARDIGPTQIHGIGASDVLSAPTFADLAPYVVQAMTGRTVVAHNVRFDLLFLYYELTRAGMDLAMPPVTGLCTMEWSGHYLRSSSRRLADCCAAAGIELRDAHAAINDARATAALLAHFIDSDRPQPRWSAELAPARGYVWPQTPEPWPTVAMTPRGSIVERRPGEWLDRIVGGMPRHADARVESYLEILEAALLDRYLSTFEEQALMQMAELLGLDATDLRGIHRTYLEGLAAVALEDGIVTEDERADIDRVAELLGLTASDVDAALAGPAPSTPTAFRLHHGDHVCLTGQMSRPREAIEADAAALGLLPGSLTKKTRLLVAADPDSQSGKAAKARTYGIPVVTEQAFVRLLSEMN